MEKAFCPGIDYFKEWNETGFLCDLEYFELISPLVRHLNYYVYITKDLDYCLARTIINMYNSAYKSLGKIPDDATIFVDTKNNNTITLRKYEDIGLEL